MEQKDRILTLMDEDGEKIEFEHLDCINNNGREFVILLPLKDKDEEDEEVLILEVKRVNGEIEEYIPVEDRQILDAVFDEFKERMKDEFNFIG